MTRRKYRRPATLLKYRRLAIIPIFPGLHHQLYPNDFVNSSLSWDGLQVTLMQLGRTTMVIFMRFYLKMAIINNGAKMNMIRILPMHEYPLATPDLD